MNEASPHRPVMAGPLLDLAGVRPGERWVDCTLGRGGHTRGLLEAGAEVWSIDRDPDARAWCARTLAEFGDQSHLLAGNFGDVLELLTDAGVLAEGPIDGLIADLGVSSPQLDDAARGFAFRAAGPVDMRMDPDRGPTALELIRDSEPNAIARWLKTYGEEPFAGPIARALKAWAVGEGPFDTVTMAQVVTEALPRKVVAKRQRHPATRTFQAIRIAVNDELGALDRLLEALPELLAVGGRALLISFHSLEDRRVKHAFARLAGRVNTSPRGRRGLPPPTDVAKPQFALLTPKAVRPTEVEVGENPRARSALLRGVIRQEAA